MPLTWPWWTINGEDLMYMLQRVADGDDPEQVYSDAYLTALREPLQEDQ